MQPSRFSRNAFAGLMLLAITVSVPIVYETNLPPDGNGTMDSVAIWVAPDPNQSLLFMTDKSRDYLEVHNAATNTYLGRIGGTGSGAGQLNYPNGVGVAYQVNTGVGLQDVVFAVERENHRVSAFALPEQTFIGSFGSVELEEPYGIAFYRQGSQLQAWVTDNSGSTDFTFVFDIVPTATGLTGNLLFSFATAGTLESIVIDPVSQRALLCDEAAGNVMVYDLQGNFLQRFGAGLFVDDPEGIVLYDLGGGAGYIIVADQNASPTQFEVFDRQTYQYIGNFTGPTTGTDGIALTQSPLPNLPNGSFYAIDSDRTTHAYDWAAIANAMGLQIVVIGGAPTITVSSPNGGEIWEAGSVHNITWSNSGFSAPVNLETSLDGGASWNLLADNVANSGAYAWTLPATPSAQARVRVSEAADNDPSDASNNDFTITNLPLAPNNLAATATSSTSISLSWNDNSTIESGYKIERKAGSGAFGEIAVLGANAVSFADNGLAANTSYTYQVRAFNANGNSSYSNSATAATPNPGGSSNLALNKPATASSTSSSSYLPSKAVDGSTSTYWRSGSVNSRTITWLRVDLQTVQTVSRVVINWRSSYYARRYEIQVSSDDVNWSAVHVDNSGNGGTDDVSFAPVTARYLRIYMTRNNKSSERINELEVYAGVAALARRNDGAQAARASGDFILAANYPNPFNPTTTIHYHLPEAAKVALKVYDLLGAEVATLVEGLQAEGDHRVTFDARDLPSGVYLYVLQAGETRLARRLLLMK